MKRVTAVTLAILAFILSSCEKLEGPRYADPEFDNIENYLDKSQRNKFKESAICGLWALEAVTRETYCDGVLTETEDLSGYYGVWTIDFAKDHTTSYGGGGTWRYSYNHLMWGAPGSYYVYEVVQYSSGSLWLKGPEPGPLGVAASGSDSEEQNYLIYKYRSQKKRI